MLFRTDKPRERQAPAAAGGPGPATLGEASEEWLVGQARALDEEAWAEIYRRHAQQVYAYIHYRLGDQHTSEDLTADVFVRALAGIKGYSYRGTPLLAWLYRIAHNVTADYRKAAAKRAQYQGADGPEDIEESRDALQVSNERQDMLRAIRALTEDQQQVVILRFYQGMSNADVARVMGKPEGAVKALQTRALRALRRLLTEGNEGRKSA